MNWHGMSEYPNDSNNNQRDLSWGGRPVPTGKTFFLIALLPALIAGAFSIAPKLYDIATEPRAELQYEESVGPSLTVDEQSQRIYAIRVVNSGKRPLTNVIVDISGPRSALQAHAVQQTTGIEIAFENTTTGIRYMATRLHTSETFNVSILFASTDADAAPAVAVRSDETQGTKVQLERRDDREFRYSVIGAALSMFAVFLMTLSVAFRRGPLFTVLSTLGRREDTLFYIAARLQLVTLTDELRKADGQLSYIRMGDLLLAHGLSDNQNQRRVVSVKALKCLSLIRHMADNSVKAIKRNLQLLEGGDFSEDEYQSLRSLAIPASQPIQLRSLIDEFIENQGRFAPQ